ncbi:MAG: NAD(P)-dependent glycerol-3-phosphate dehydrogenase [Lachnospiraceae bacterium]|jgi:glycerol-3-phosphate dehydrogenase (NAD(P)+)|nr:NAD(P)-dependent glycerol-3-phosphate dehydrogenase [Lachnospiraceae bacterium]
MANISILGAGSWGTALALLLHNNGHKVNVWSIDENEVNLINDTHENPSKLPGIHIPKEINFTTELESSCKGYDVLVTAVPSPFTRSTAKKMAPFITDGQIIVDVAKGIEESTQMRLSEQILEEIPNADVTCLSGPSHAEEVAREIPTAVCIGAKSEKTATYLQEIFTSRVFRVYTSPDMVGMELGGSLKNVIALAAGMSDGLGYGDNTKAALITRGIKEIAALGVAEGGSSETFYGLSGMGDLIVTCDSVHSRNRKAGFLIGQGKSYQEAMDEVKMIVEGVYSAKAAMALGKKHGLTLPIIEQVNKILFEGKNPREAVLELMTRIPRSEHMAKPWEE